MERRYWEPPDSIKLLMIIVAVPFILVLGLLNLLWMMTRYGAFRLFRLLAGRG